MDEMELQVMCLICGELQTDVICGTHIKWVECESCLSLEPTWWERLKNFVRPTDSEEPKE